MSLARRSSLFVRSFAKRGTKSTKKKRILSRMQFRHACAVLCDYLCILCVCLRVLACCVAISLQCALAARRGATLRCCRNSVLLVHADICFAHVCFVVFFQRVFCWRVVALALFSFFSLRGAHNEPCRLCFVRWRVVAAPYDFSKLYTESKIKFPKSDAEYPTWLPELLQPRPDIREMSAEKDGQVRLCVHIFVTCLSLSVVRRRRLSSVIVWRPLLLFWCVACCLFVVCCCSRLLCCDKLCHVIFDCIFIVHKLLTVVALFFKSISRCN